MGSFIIGLVIALVAILAILLNLLVGAVILVLLAGAVAPLESLGWWSEKGADEASRTLARIASGELDDDLPKTDHAHYVVYLSGIGALDGASIPAEEQPLLDGLQARLPGALVINDVFPYSPANRALTGSRALSAMWRHIESARLKKPESVLGFLVNGRNALQLFTSADRRYGPTFSLGTAQEIGRSLVQHGYELGGGKRVTLIGWSGGGQVSVGAAWFLAGAGIPVDVVSLGGMLSDDPGLDRVEHLWHLHGTRDGWERMGRFIFAGRWPSAPFSHWNKALKSGRLTEIPIGPFQHSVTEHYFDPDAHAPDGRSYLQVSLDGIVAVLTGQPVTVCPPLPEKGRGGRRQPAAPVLDA
jgi:hypothetical protein